MKTAFLSLLFALLVTGCTQIPQQPPAQKVSWLIHQQQLENLTDWSLSGKLAIITQEERHSLNIYWAQTDNDFHITLTTFLGVTVLDIKKTSIGTQIIDNNGERFFGKDSEALIKRLSGLVIPIDVLQQWIKGNPNDASYQLNKNNQVESLAGHDQKNALWSINYQQYSPVQGIYLPQKLQLKRLDLRLKFAISKWQLK